MSSAAGGASPRSPSALRNELAAAKKAVEVRHNPLPSTIIDNGGCWWIQTLKNDKAAVEEKLDKLHQVLEKERTALRDVLAAGWELFPHVCSRSVHIVAWMHADL